MAAVVGDEALLPAVSTSQLPVVGGGRPVRHVALAASGVALIAAACSVAGLTIAETYRDGPVVEAALRGGDLVTAFVVAPTLLVAAGFMGRGRGRARPVVLGLLAYLVYGYAYYVFTASFGPLFLAHVAVFVGAAITLCLGLNVSTDRPTGRTWGERAVGVWLVLVGAAVLWSFGSAVVRFGLDGELPTDVLPFPEWRVHLGYAMDLSVAVPAALVAGVGLLRRTTWGLNAGTTVCVWLAAYQVNYLVSHMFLAEAGVASVQVTDPIPYVTVGVFLIPVVALLRRPPASLGTIS